MTSAHRRQRDRRKCNCCRRLFRPDPRNHPGYWRGGRNAGAALQDVSIAQLSFFVMVLALSRHTYLECTVSQTIEHYLACHEHGFAAFGGVPSKIMVDNLKSAVLLCLAGAAPVFNPRYLDFARHHGFAIEACNVARGNEKGQGRSGRAVYAEWKQCKAGLDYHVEVDKHYYSVRHALDGMLSARRDGRTDL